MEETLRYQEKLMQLMNELYRNYKKDGPTRRTVQNITAKLSSFDAFWQTFLSNHGKLLGCKQEDLPYLTENKYEQTKKFYTEVREIFIEHLETAQREAQQSLPPPMDWAQESDPESQSKSDLQDPGTATGTPTVNEKGSETPKFEFEQQRTLNQHQSNPGNQARESSRDDKLAEMMRKQQSQFKAFARTVFYTDINSINEQWELEDVLKTIKTRWETIDSLHWDIDSELRVDDESYNQTFYKYEKKFQDIKKQINTKIWSMNHREKATPTMDIPTFSGNYHQWTSFKDLFTEAIHNNRSISNAQKMQFLKNKVRGEAEKLIQHLNISSENYDICWNILNHRYNNMKLIFSAHVNNLLSIPTVQHQSYTQIKRLHDTTNECLNAIKNLGIDTSTWDPLIVHILSQKLDTEIHTEYIESLQNPRELPSLKDFLHFLEMKFTSYESSRRKMDTSKPSAPPETYKKPFYKSFGIRDHTPKENIQKSSFYQRKNCPVCANNHGIFHCETFLASNIDGKRKIIAKHNLCKNCLYNHNGKDCFSDKRCRTCNGRHNTLVHDVYSASKTETGSETQNQRKFVANVAQENTDIETLIATALIKVKSSDGSYHKMRALIDPCSQVSLISEKTAQLLQLPRKSCNGVVYGIGAKGNNCKGTTTISASALKSNFDFSAEVFIMKTLINNLPNTSFCKPSWTSLKDIDLADPEFYISRPIDLLLGAKVYAAIIQSGVIKENESLVAQKSRLGWLITGGAPSSPSYQCNIVINNIDDIQRFWTVEDIAEKSNLSTEDQYCLKYYQETTTRQEDGRYVVRLPLNPEKRDALGVTKKKAIAQFLQLEKKFQKNKKLAEEYKNFIHEYIKLGHMRECQNDSLDDSNATLVYIPHHCVLRLHALTTLLRVVFNASDPSSNGLSLNDIMFSGPNLQQELLSLIIKWRQYPIAFTADIEKMFRQILLNIKDQNYQRIIWRDSPDQPLRQFVLTTISYGQKAAPFLSMMTLKQLASDERHNYPEAAKVLEESFYMDDLLHGSYDLQSAKKLQADLINLLRSGGFNLRKWSSNRPELLEGVSTAHELQPTFEFKDQECTKTLGLRWHPEDDQFTFQLKIDPATTSEKITKRTLLSNISKVFDPLGWLSPVTTKLKLLFQRVISHQIQWDDQVPDDIKKDWVSISNDLLNIKNIKVPRWLKSKEKQSIELHGFCDASSKAYACVIYCRTIDHERKQPTPPVIVAAKSRLVPANKNITLPRLELCAAQLLSKLMETVKKSLSNFDIKTFGWSDSTAVLGWLQGDPNKWKPFITNRVIKITEIMPADNWDYVKTGENPADCASRGIKAEQLIQHPLWWNGPTWLESYNQNLEKPTFTTDQEINTSKQCHVATTHHASVITDVINKLSCLTRATRVVAWMLRALSRDATKSTYLTTEELRRARNKIIKHVQYTEFPDEVSNLKKNQPVESKSRILSLKPFLDDDGMLRVGGRIENAHIKWEMRHPLIIPHNSRLTELIIDQAHKNTFHGGARLTLAHLRQSYWIVGGNRATKKRLRQCVTCRKQNPKKMCQIMGDLPECRLNATRPFEHTGIDYTGFVNVKANKGRGIKTTKAYIAVFVCMSTRAVHLEIVSELSSEAFLAALKRMSARRGAPCHIYSDNGTNFVGASRIIKKEYAEIKATLDESFFNAISDMNIKWHFNAPSWPSAGGLWEAAVKSLKHHLCRVIGNQHLTFEEFSTLLSQIEACLNARPLCALSEDPDDINYLTPSHFLSSGPTLNIIETERDERTRWRLSQKIFQDIWKKWQAEYLCHLQSRSKWTSPRSNIKVDDVVIIHDANLPAGKWAMGRVTEVHPGKDGYVRVASVKTKNGIIKRPIIKLSILPVSENQESSATTPIRKNCKDESNQNINREKPKIAPRKKGINFITMALMLFMLLMTPVQCAYNISNFKSEQGIYFDKLSNMKLARDEWKLVVYYDINPYWQGSDLFNAYIEHLDQTCRKIKNQAQCNVVLLQLRHAYSELNYYNSILLGQRTELSRKKRGLINGIGNIAHSLFGVLDEQFAEQYQKDIELTRINERHLANLWKNQTSIIEAESNLLQRVENAMNKQHKIFNQHLNSLEKITNQMGSQVENLSETNEFTLSSIIANSILVNLKSIQDTLLDTITNVLHGKFNIHLLTPQQLQDELNIIAGQVSKDLSLLYKFLALILS